MHQERRSAEAALRQSRKGYNAEYQLAGRRQEKLLGARLVEHQRQRALRWAAAGHRLKLHGGTGRVARADSQCLADTGAANRDAGRAPCAEDRKSGLLSRLAVALHHKLVGNFAGRRGLRTDYQRVVLAKAHRLAGRQHDAGLAPAGLLAQPKPGQRRQQSQIEQRCGQYARSAAFGHQVSRGAVASTGHAPAFAVQV